MPNIIIRQKLASVESMMWPNGRIKNLVLTEYDFLIALLALENLENT